MSERIDPDSRAQNEADVPSGGGEARPFERRRRGPGRPPAKRPRSRWVRYAIVAGRDIAIIVVTVAAIVFSVNRVRPIFANQPKVAESVVRTVPITKPALAPTPKDSTDLERITHTPKFEADRQAFAADLVKTGYVEPSRADS